MNILQVNQSDTPKPTKDQTKKPCLNCMEIFWIKLQMMKQI